MSPVESADRRPRQVRVFVSSSFKDMIEDRNELDTHAWPRLRLYCQARQAELVVVDLKWGITESQSRRNELLALLFDEIDKCRPYFIGLVGERYGSPLREGSFTAELLAQEPWIAALRNRSATELEMHHAVLKAPAEASRASFYFRDPAYALARGGDFLSATKQDEDRQNDLKRRIKESAAAHRGVVLEPYPAPAALPDLVCKHLEAAIEADFPLAATPDESSRATSAHQAFAASLRTVYVCGDKYFPKLDAHARSDGLPLMVTGAPGIGKSALLANWAGARRKSHPDDFLFDHYVGPAPESRSHLNVIRRLVEAIKQWTKDPDPIPDGPAALIRDFRRWLTRLEIYAAHAGARAIAIIDGLDHLADADQATRLRWLPENVFHGALRLVTSSTPSTTGVPGPLESAKELGWEQAPIDDLSLEERELFITRYLNSRAKHLEPNQIGMLAGARAGATPLFLKIVMDELVITGRFGLAMEPILQRYVAAETIPALLDQVLTRWESAYDRERPGLVRDAISLIWSARRGLSEDELAHLLRPPGQSVLPAALWSPFRSALWEFVTSFDGILSFSRDDMRAAVKQRFVKDADTGTKYRGQLAEEFAKVGITRRACDELPWLLKQLGRVDELKSFLLKRGVFLLLKGSALSDLFDYWEGLGDPAGVGQAYETAFARWHEPERTFTRRDVSLDAHELALFLQSFSARQSAVRLLSASLSNMEAFSGTDAPEAAHVLRTRASLLKELGNTNAALEDLRRAIDIDTKWYGAYDPVTAKDLYSVALLLEYSEQYDQALQALLRVRLICDASGDGDLRARVLVAIGSVRMNKGDVDGALEALDVALHKEHLLESAPSEALAFALACQGQIRDGKSEFDEAVRCYEKSIEIYEALYGARNFSVVRQINNLAVTYMHAGRVPEAKAALQRVVPMLDHLSERGDPEVATAYTNLSVMFAGTGDYEQALRCSTRAQTILAPLRDRPRAGFDYSVSLNHHGLALLRSGRPKEARTAWLSGLRQVLTAVKCGRPAGEDLSILLANIVQGLQESGLTTEQTYNAVREIFEDEQMMDLHYAIASKWSGKDGGKHLPVQFLSRVTPEVLPAADAERLARTRGELTRQIDLNLARMASAVPRSILASSRALTSAVVDDIAFQCLQVEDRQIPHLHFRFSERGNPVLFLFSVFSGSKESARRVFVEYSSEPGLGYFTFPTWWINNWPGPSLTAIFHLIVTHEEDRRWFHCCFMDNARGARAPKEFMTLPVDILTPLERSTLKAQI